MGHAALVPTPVMAKEAGDFFVRFRAITVIPDEGGADVDSWIFGLGVGYRF